MKKTPKVPKPRIALKPTPSPKANTSSTGNPSKWIPIEHPFALPEAVRAAIDRLIAAGFVAYVVGGSVRDYLLGRESKDHDVATDARPDELLKIFPDSVTVGKAFGVLKIPLQRESKTGGPAYLEIATFRQDLEYKDGRHPVGVKFAGPAEDAQRRDFSINALYFDPKTSRLMDSVGGIDDLRAGRLRAIGDPEERFREDALRLLRAVRFASGLEFEIEKRTEMALLENANLIRKVSPERIRDELTAMWLGASAMRSLAMLSESGLLALVLPELEALRKMPGLKGGESAVWKHLLKALTHLRRHLLTLSPVLAWSALLMDVGKPAAAKRSEGKNFNGHEKLGAELAMKIADRLKMSRADCDGIGKRIEGHVKLREVFQMREATLQRLIREPEFPDLLALHRADATATDGNLAFYEFAASTYQKFLVTAAAGDAKLVTGADLIQLGLKPGPHFSEILHSIEDLALERKLSTKEEALEYVVRNFVN